MPEPSEAELRENRARAEEQLDVYGSSGGPRLLILRLLEIYWRSGLDHETRSKALGAFVELANGHALPQSAHSGFDWVPAKPGQLVVRDYVRVRTDAYPGGTGVAHNGRSGPIVSIRHGDIIVRYDDGGPVPAMGARHSPHVLEKRIAR